MILELGLNKIEFKSTELEFIEKNLKNCFTNKNNKTLLETLNDRRYKTLKEHFKNSEESLKIPLGKFLFDLKSSENDIYKLFLNSSGDKDFCKFKLKDKNISNLRGIYIYTVENEIKYIGRCCDSFYKRIDNGYGRISPKNCYRDGQKTNCHINNLININIEKINLWIYAMENEKEIKKLEVELIKKYKPNWNIRK